MLSKKLNRQLNKCFESEDFQSVLTQIIKEIKSNNEVPQELKDIILKLPPFFQSVDESYELLEKKLTMSNRAMNISMDELSVANRRFYAMNRSLNAVLNSLGEGLILFGEDGVVKGTFSKSCVDLLEVENPEGMHLFDILNIEGEDRETYTEWLKLITSRKIDFEDAAGLGPEVYHHSNLRRHIQLSYKPVLSELDDELEGIVLIAVDKSQEKIAQDLLKEMQDRSEMIVRVTTNKIQFYLFINELRKAIHYFSESDDMSQEYNLDEIKRVLHNIKGGAVFLYLNEFSELCHRFEHELILAKEAQANRDRYVRLVRSFGKSLEDKLESFMLKYSGIIDKNLFQGLSKEFSMLELKAFAKKLNLMRGGEHFAHLFYEKFVAISFGSLFEHFSDVLGQMAENQDKKMKQLKIHGGEVLVDAEHYEGFISSLVNLFINIITHGIEHPSDRVTLGKDEEGEVLIRIFPYQKEEERRIKIEIRDDGRGIDARDIRNKLREDGMTDKDLKKKSDEDIIQHIFDSGFTTKRNVTKSYGRGVGMNSIKEQTAKLGGSVYVESQKGKYALFVFDLPHIDTMLD